MLLSEGAVHDNQDTATKTTPSTTSFKSAILTALYSKIISSVGPL